jgi:hypothetical protein
MITVTDLGAFEGGGAAVLFLSIGQMVWTPGRICIFALMLLRRPSTSLSGMPSLSPATSTNPSVAASFAVVSGVPASDGVEAITGVAPALCGAVAAGGGPALRLLLGLAFGFLLRLSKRLARGGDGVLSVKRSFDRRHGDGQRRGKGDADGQVAHAGYPFGLG